jgi:tetratricopeptide (TPR) repeat protein
MIAWVQEDLGNLLVEQGDYATARTSYEKALAGYRQLGHTFDVASMLGQLGMVAHQQGDIERAMALLEEAASADRAWARRDRTAVLLNLPGLRAIQRRDYPKAAAHFSESLALYRDIGHRPGAAVALAGLAEAIGGQGALKQAARLFGAADVMLDATGGPMPRPVRDQYERTAAAVRDAMGEAAFTAAWAAGRALSLDEAVTEALAQPVAT